MSLVYQHPIRNEATATPRIVADRRRYKRIRVDILGRFMRADKLEYACRLHDISIGGAALLSEHVELLAPGERIVAYFDQLGRIEGTVGRIFNGGFAVDIQAGIHRREKLCAQLMWMINKSEMPGIDERRHDRIAPKNGSAELKLAEDIVVACSILDVSISGASIGTDARPPIGQEVQLGKLRAQVVRHHENGIGLRFLDIQNPNALRKFIA